MSLDADIKITGSKQGAFKHQNPIKSRQGTSVVVAANHEIEAPRDNVTGLAHGKREHKPFRVVMPMDSSIINIETAITTNETLSSVMIRFYQTATQTMMQGGAGGAGGEAKPYFTVELKSAVVNKVEFVHPHSRSVDPEKKSLDIHAIVHFTYMEITKTWVEGGMTMNDAWNTAI